MKNQKPPHLLVLIEEPLAGEENATLTHVLEILRKSFKADFINAEKMTESQLIQEIKKVLPTLAIGENKLRLVAGSHSPPQNLNEFKNRTSHTTASSVDETTKALIESFQTRYHDAQLQIRQIEVKIEHIVKTGGNGEEVKELQLWMEALAHRQRAWIKALNQTLQTQKSRPKTPKGSP